MKTETGKLTDEQIIANHDVGVRTRAKRELAIVNQFLDSARERNYSLEIMEMTRDEMADYDGDIKSALFDLDDAHVEVSDASGEALGWVYFVFGNDGYDVISDYITTLEPLLAECDALARRMEETGDIR